MTSRGSINQPLEGMFPQREKQGQSLKVEMAWLISERTQEDGDVDYRREGEEEDK